MRRSFVYGYEKDIFGSFAYDFELSQKLIFG